MKPWSQLTPAQQERVRQRFIASGASSVNGVAGWYQTQQLKPSGLKSRFRLLYEVTKPAPIEALTIDDVKDLINANN